MSRPSVRVLVAGTLSAVLVAGCTSADVGPGEGGPSRPPQSAGEGAGEGGAAGTAYRVYAALGDSFTAAPLVPNTHLAQGCLRSDGNYPSIVAERLAVEVFRDASCSGATTAHLTGSQPTVRETRVPPQLRAVRADTDLVTLGIGGNDFDLFATLVARCARPRGPRPDGSPCADSLAERHGDLAKVVERIGDRVARALRRVRARASGATVVLVGYPRLLPDRGRCPDLPLGARDHRAGVRLSRALNRSLVSAAERSGALFVDMYAASAGHDICADEPWVNGARTTEGVALAFHPLAAGTAATADAVLAELARTS